MKYKQLGNTGLLVSQCAFGAMTFGTGDFYGFKYTLGQAEANNLVAQAIELGVNLFDTADFYNFGGSEQILGKALGSRRKDVIVATKVGLRVGQGVTQTGLSARHIIASAENSLKRLGTDYIDLYQIHTVDPLTPFEETARALDDLVRRGLVRYIGCSNHPAWKVASAVGLQRERGYARFVSHQVYYSLVGRDIERDIAPQAVQDGLGLLIWSPLAGGFLSGKYSREQPQGDGGRLASFEFIPVDKERGYTIVDKVKEIAKAHDATPAQVSLAWLLSKPYVTSVIVGFSKPEQMQSNLAAARLQLTAEQLAQLDAVSATSLPYPNWMLGRPDPVIEKAMKGG